MADDHGPSWSTAMMALLISHVGGDMMLQTEWQALTKIRGLGDPEGRRALFSHLVSYTSAYVPALLWIGRRRGPRRALALGAAVSVPHLLVDDGHAVDLWLRTVKRSPNPALGLRIAVDQSFHLICLFGASLLVGG